MEAELTQHLSRVIEELTSEVRLLRTSRIANTESIPLDQGLTGTSVEVALLADPLEPEGFTICSDEEAALADLKVNVAKSQDELNLIVRELARSDDEKCEMERSVALLQVQIQNLETTKGKLENELASLDASRLTCEALREEATVLSQRIQRMQDEEDRLKTRHRELELREGEALRGLQEGRHASQFLARLWPVWLKSPDLQGWKERLELDVFNQEAPPSFGLLFASIHTYTAALRDPDSRFLLDALRELGRRLYQWLKDLDLDEMAVAEQVEVWASSINTESVGRASIQVANPGTPANNKWMVFAPKGGSSPDVVSVRSWCVIDQQGRPIHRAEVVV